MLVCDACVYINREGRIIYKDSTIHTSKEMSSCYLDSQNAIHLIKVGTNGNAASDVNLNDCLLICMSKVWGWECVKKQLSRGAVPV